MQKQQNKTKTNRSKAKGKMVRAPAFSNKSSSQSGQQSRRYRESERILTVSGAVSYSVEHSVAVNPGLPASFPWLSGHAQLYEKFKVHRLIFRYKNLKGTSSAGNILMSFDYDTLDSAQHQLWSRHNQPFGLMVRRGESSRCVCLLIIWHGLPVQGLLWAT